MTEKIGSSLFFKIRPLIVFYRLKHEGIYGNATSLVIIIIVIIMTSNLFFDFILAFDLTFFSTLIKLDKEGPC